VLCCAAAFPFLALLTALVALMMRLTSPGPVFFRQERVGLNGRTFRLYKFRTMHVNSDSRQHQNYFSQLVQSNSPMEKMDSRGDSRLIPGGWILRSAGLDELPQIVNVWRREMSIVGPRPCLPSEYEQYTDEQRHRFASVPGLTGLWQVSGKNRTTFQEMIQLDLEYGHRCRLGLDLQIIFRTIPALCRQLIEIGRARSARRKPAALESAVSPVASNRR
jgi:exopolysaccharide production protein ExoY